MNGLGVRQTRASLVAGNGLATQAHVMQPFGLGAKVDLDIAQILAVSQQRKSHRQELVHAGEVLDLVVASVRSNATAKSAQRQERHELRENKLALVHNGPCEKTQKTISHGIDFQIETRLKCQKLKVNH